jgi:hypothetical protein
MTASRRAVVRLAPDSPAGPSIPSPRPVSDSRRLLGHGFSAESKYYLNFNKLEFKPSPARPIF